MGTERGTGVLNIKPEVSWGGGSCGDALSDPISISCSPAELPLRLGSDFYPSRQGPSGTVALFSGASLAAVYTNHDTVRPRHRHTLEEDHLGSVYKSVTATSIMISLWGLIEAPLGRDQPGPNAV